jgi:hypothetical protein
MTKNLKKFKTGKKFIFFKTKIAIFLSLGLYKGQPSYRRSLQPSEEKIQQFKQEIFFFFLFLRSFLPSLIRILIQQLKLMRIHADPEPQFFKIYAGSKNSLRIHNTDPMPPRSPIHFLYLKRPLKIA